MPQMPSIVFVDMRAVVYCSVLRGHSRINLKSEHTFLFCYLHWGKQGCSLLMFKGNTTLGPLIFSVALTVLF